ncbi:MAG: VOC family protein [Phycisphaerales bacterium]
MSDFNSEKNRFVWMDIPVDDLDRACEFYAGVLGIEVHQESFGEVKFAVLAHEDGNGGCLIPRPEGVKAVANGIMVYLNVDGRIKDASDQVIRLGGKIVMETHAIGPHGFRAMIEDSEGNAFALHSNTDA